MSYNPNNPNGQSTAANSAPVVIASDQSKIPVQLNSGQMITATGSASALNADLYPATDVSTYNQISLQVTGTWTGTISFQTSNDNSNWVSTTLMSASSGTTSGNQSINANGLYYGPVSGQYFRLRMTAYTSGTASATVILRSLPAPTHAVGTATVLVSRTTGGLSVHRIKSAASTNATLVKGSAIGLYGMVLSNDSASKRYIKFFNKSTTPTVGTDTPSGTIMIPANSTISVPMSDIALSTFAAGLSYSITGAIADSDTTAIGADEIHGMLWYA